MAPEVAVCAAYGPPADVFGVGIIMWELWHGKRAYKDDDAFTLPPSPVEFALKVMNEDLRPQNFSPPEELDQDVANKWQILMEGCWVSRSASYSQESLRCR